MAKSLIAKCGKTGFRSIQGMLGHERMCVSCQALAGVVKPEQKKEAASTQKKSAQSHTKKGCQHNYIPLTDEYKAQKDEWGRTLGSLGFDVVCTKCGDLL